MGRWRARVARLTEGPLHHSLCGEWSPLPTSFRLAGRRVVVARRRQSYLPFMPSSQLNTDVVLGVAIPLRNARGRIARLRTVVDQVLANHAYPPAIEKLLAEALTLTALLGSLLKEPQGQLTLQAQTQGGIVDLMVCDYLGGALRGYV